MLTLKLKGDGEMHLDLYEITEDFFDNKKKCGINKHSRFVCLYYAKKN